MVGNKAVVHQGKIYITKIDHSRATKSVCCMLVVYKYISTYLGKREGFFVLHVTSINR